MAESRSHLPFFVDHQSVKQVVEEQAELIKYSKLQYLSKILYE